MTLNELQNNVDEWIKTYGVRYFSELTNTVLLMEEVGELARHIARKYGEQSYKEIENAENFSKEFGDVLFVLVCLANQCNINLEEVLQKNLKEKALRDYDRHKNNPKLK